HAAHLALHPFPTRRSSDLKLHRAQIKPAQIKTDPIDIIARLVAAVAPGGAQAATGLIGLRGDPLGDRSVGQPRSVAGLPGNGKVDRKSTRLSSSHRTISYA